MESLLPLIIIPIFVLMFVGAIFFAIKSAKNMRQQFELLAQKFGLEYIPPKGKIFKSKPQIHGSLFGKTVQIYTYTTGSGKNKQTYTKFSLLPFDKGLIVRISKEGLFSKVSKAFGGQDIQIGDALLDKQYRFKCNRGNDLIQWIDYDIAEMLKTVHKSLRGSILIINGELSYSQHGIISNENARERFEKVMAILFAMSQNLDGIKIVETPEQTHNLEFE